jgi:hypothetical protein
MVFAASDRAVSQADRDIADPDGPGRGGRSTARLPDPQGPCAEAPDGGEDRGLYGEDRPRDRQTGRPASASPAPLTDAATAFLRAVRANLADIADLAGFAVEEIHSRRWSSVTFEGARIRLAFRLEGDGAEAAAAKFLAGLDCRNFRLRGHLLADLSPAAQERRSGFVLIRLDALTVEEK